MIKIVHQGRGVVPAVQLKEVRISVLVDKFRREKAAEDLQVSSMDYGEGREHFEGGVPETNTANAKGEAALCRNGCKALLDL